MEVRHNVGHRGALLHHGGAQGLHVPRRSGRAARDPQRWRRRRAAEVNATGMAGSPRPGWRRGRSGSWGVPPAPCPAARPVPGARCSARAALPTSPGSVRQWWARPRRCSARRWPRAAGAGQWRRSRNPAGARAVRSGLPRTPGAPLRRWPAARRRPGRSVHRGRQARGREPGRQIRSAARAGVTAGRPELDAGGRQADPMGVGAECGSGRG